MDPHMLIWNTSLWVFNLIILLTVLYVVTLLKRITGAIEKNAAKGN